MNRKQLRSLLVSCLLLAALAGGKWFGDRYVLFRWNALPRDARQLDLRAEELTAADFEKLQAKLPDCEILWLVPFQEQKIPSDTESLRVATLREEDAALLVYFPELRRLDASGCEDYAQLMALPPELEVRYQVALGGTLYENDTAEMHLTDPDMAELEQKLPWLPALKTLYLTGKLPEVAQLQSLQQTFPEINIQWEISAGDTAFSSVARSLDLTGTALSFDALRELLRWLPGVETVDLTGCTLTDEELMALADAYPGCFFRWEMTIGSLKIPTDAVEIDISGQKLESTEQIEGLLPYFPNAEKIIMSHCGFDDETMDDLNRRYPDIRFVWTVRIKNLEVRTDETWFYPVKINRNMVVESKDLYPLRYCTDMVCIDVGHMWGVKDCEWAAFMPNLRYLVLAYTSVADLTPLSGLKNLAYLEIFHTPVKDYSPLIGCTGLEDLNLSMTTGDYRPLMQMTWLKNLWWNGMAGTYGLPCSGAHLALPEALTDTNLQFYGEYAAYKSGWRKLPNYYAMRDYLGMFYLN